MVREVCRETAHLEDRIVPLSSATIALGGEAFAPESRAAPGTRAVETMWYRYQSKIRRFEVAARRLPYPRRIDSRIRAALTG
jgi:hypothetical protein